MRVPKKNCRPEKVTSSRDDKGEGDASMCETAIADTGNGSWRGLASRDLSLRFSKCERFLQGRLRGADAWRLSGFDPLVANYQRNNDQENQPANQTMLCHIASLA